MRRYSCIAFYNKKGQIFFQQRTDDAPTLPGQWAYFGGGIDEDESPEEACVREIKEELGYALSLSDVQIAFEFDVETDRGLCKKYLFVEPFDQSQPICLLEGKGMAWFAESDIEHLNMSDYNKRLAKQLFEYIENV